MSKKVTICRLSLVNFKGLRNVAISFGDTVTTISGRNATGKTTVKDAFCWLLWGKDSEGNADTNFGIKTTDAAGNFIPDLEHEVSGTFQVTDTETGETQTIELRRALVEDWRVPKGETERVLKGNHTDYFCNDVPCKKADYEKKINDIIPESVFKMITDPYNFLTQNWKTQRELLLQIAGDVKPTDIAESNADFAALLAQLTGKTLEEYRKEVAAKRKKVNDRLEKIPTMIDAITRVTPQAPDYAALELKKQQLEAQLTEIETATASAVEANRLAYEKAAKVQGDINDRKSRQQKAVFDATEAARKEAYAKNEAYLNAEAGMRQIGNEERTENATHEANKQRVQFAIDGCDKTIADYKKQQDDLRTTWHETNKKEFEQTEQLVCPLFQTVCGDQQTIARYNADRDAARNNFIEDKRKKLTDITAQGKELAAKIEAEEKRKAEFTAQLATENDRHEKEVKRIEESRATYTKIMTEHPKVSTDVKVEPTSVAEWVQLQAEIDALTAQLPTAGQTSGEDTAELGKKKAAISADLDAVKAQLGVRTTIETNEAQIKTLRDEAATLAQEKADLQNTETTIDDFTRATMDEVERRVNALFSRVQFKMYRQLVNGEKEQDCIAMVGGVPFRDLNTAGKINAGLDVINALCAFHGVNAPIFADNAESINDFIPTTSQLVKLVVTTGDFKIEQV